MAVLSTAGHPPARDLEIYHAWVCEAVRQVDLAAQFGLSQARIAQLCREVREWVDLRLPERAAGLDAGDRLHLAIALRWARLSAGYEPHLQRFGGAAGWLKLCEQKEAAVAGLLSEAEAKEAAPDRVLVLAGEILVELQELRDLADRGPFARTLDGLPTEFPPAPPPQQPLALPAAAVEDAPLSAGGTAIPVSATLSAER